MAIVEGRQKGSFKNHDEGVKGKIKINSEEY